MRYFDRFCLLGLLAMALLGAACSKSGEHNASPAQAPAPTTAAKPAAPPAAPATPLTAEQVFATRCATCHGTDGKGDGPAAAALNPKPRNYTDQAWQKSVTDEHIKQTIVGGGASVGKSPLMAPNPDLAGNDAVLDGLVKIIRNFGKQSS